MAAKVANGINLQSTSLSNVGSVTRTGTETWTAPDDTTIASVYNQPNTVTTVGSSNMHEWRHKGVLTSRMNEWGGYRVDVPSVATLGYADVGIKIKECPDGGEDGLQVFGPGGTKRFYVRDGLATALKGVVAPAVNSPFISAMNNIWYGIAGTGTTASISLTNGRSYAFPLSLVRARTLSGVGLAVTTLGTGNFRASLYSGSDLVTAVLVTDYGLVSAASTGTKTWTPSNALNPGDYWVVITSVTSGTAPICRARNGTTPGVGMVSSADLNGPVNSYYTDAASFLTAAPAAFGSIVDAVQGPQVTVKFSA